MTVYEMKNEIKIINNGLRRNLSNLRRYCDEHSTTKINGCLASIEDQITELCDNANSIVKLMDADKLDAVATRQRAKEILFGGRSL